MIWVFADHEEEHRQKAEYWMLQGRPDYAAGSLRKAAKWNEKRRIIDFSFHGAYPKNALDSLVEDDIKRVDAELSKAFELAILRGEENGNS